MIINKETITLRTLSILNNVLSLPEVEQIKIKDIVISSATDMENIKTALDKSYHDRLSDVDFCIWTKQSPNDFSCKEPVYKKHFSRLGLSEELLGVLFQNRDENGVECHRICLTDGFRADLIFYPRVDENMCDLPVENATKENPGDSFWFIAIQALGKLLRRDYLIAAHLTHMLIMEGLVVQMTERDQLYHTNFHRYGYAEKLIYRDVDIEKYQHFMRAGEDDFNHIARNLHT